jgi:DNA relaxase NicK
MYEGILLQQKMGLSPTGRRKVSLVRSAGGDTLYIGTRKTGRKFYRLYDKGFDEGFGLGVLWRAEVQYGRDMARDALKVYKEIGIMGTCVMDLVCSEFYDAAKVELFKGCKVDAEIIMDSDEKIVTVQRKLDWLALCVKPTIAFLIEQDLEDEMLDALGMGGYGRGKWEQANPLFGPDNGYGQQ